MLALPPQIALLQTRSQSVDSLLPPQSRPPTPSRDHRAQARVRTVPPLSPWLGPSRPFPVLSSPFFSCPVLPLGGRATTEKPGKVNEARLQPGHNRVVNYGARMRSRMPRPSQSLAEMLEGQAGSQGLVPATQMQPWDTMLARPAKSWHS